MKTLISISLFVVVLLAVGTVMASPEADNSTVSIEKCSVQTFLGLNASAEETDTQSHQCLVEDEEGEDKLARRGCCSWHGGVCGCSGGRAVCCDGSFSPSCGC